MAGPAGLSIAELTSRHARAGWLEAILLRPERRSLPRTVSAAALGADGLEGDHARPGKRAVTLIQAEHLPVILSLANRADLAPGALAPLLRRNLVIAGMNLAGLRGRRVRIGGAAVLEITGPCAPCSRMEAALGHGGYAAVRGHGGWCARVVCPGDLRVSDPVTPAP